MDATAGGSLMSKSAEETRAIINKMALNDLQSNHNKNCPQKKSGILELGSNDAILAQNKILTQKLEEMKDLPQQKLYAKI